MLAPNATSSAPAGTRPGSMAAPKVPLTGATKSSTRYSAPWLAQIAFTDPSDPGPARGGKDARRPGPGEASPTSGGGAVSQ